jgi:hypothetical protein
VVDTPENRAIWGGQVPRGEMVLTGLPEVAHIYQTRQRVTIEATGNENAGTTRGASSNPPSRRPSRTRTGVLSMPKYEFKGPEAFARRVAGAAGRPDAEADIVDNPEVSEIADQIEKMQGEKDQAKRERDPQASRGRPRSSGTGVRDDQGDGRRGVPRARDFPAVEPEGPRRHVAPRAAGATARGIPASDRRGRQPGHARPEQPGPRGTDRATEGHAGRKPRPVDHGPRDGGQLARGIGTAGGTGRARDHRCRPHARFAAGRGHRTGTADRRRRGRSGVRPIREVGRGRAGTGGGPAAADDPRHGDRRRHERRPAPAQHGEESGFQPA